MTSKKNKNDQNSEDSSDSESFDGNNKPKLSGTLFPKNLVPSFIESSDGKKYYTMMDIELVCIAFSKHFSQNAQMPNYYINQIRENGSVWDDMDFGDDADPIRSIKEFLPHSRFPEFIKSGYFLKAQRAYQDYLVCQVLSHFILCRLGGIHYQGDPIDKIYLQPIVVTGHRAPILENEERYVVPIKHKIYCIFLTTKGGTELYLDLCSPQIDITRLSNDKTGYPYLIFRVSKNGQKRQQMQVGELYCSEHNRNVKIISVLPLIPIENEKPFKKYLKSFQDQEDREDQEDQEVETTEQNEQKRLENIEKTKDFLNQTMGEDIEFLSEYRERLSKDFKDRVTKELTSFKKRVAKQCKKKDAEETMKDAKETMKDAKETMKDAKETMKDAKETEQ